MKDFFTQLRNRYNPFSKKNTNMKIIECVVHRFTMGDVEDPDLFAAEPLWNWQESEPGKFVMTHAVEVPSWHRSPDMHYGYHYSIRAKLTEVDYTYWKLKYD